MRRSFLFLFILFLFSTSGMFAQTWKVQLQPLDGTQNISGSPLSAEFQPLQDVVETTAMVSRSRCGRCSQYTYKSDFVLTAKNLTSSTDVAAANRIYFQGIDIDNGLSSNVHPPPGFEQFPCNYPGCTNPNNFPGCLFEFINNSSGHPQQNYERAMIIVSFTGLDFLNMPSAGTPASGDLNQPPTVQFVIYALGCCPNNPAGIGLGWPPFQSGAVPATIRRISTDQWQIDVNQPIHIVEYVTALVNTGTGKKKTTSCQGVTSTGQIWTTPVKFSMIWTREP